MPVVHEIRSAVRAHLEASKVAAGLVDIKYEGRDLRNPPSQWAEVIISPDSSIPLGPNGETLTGQIIINVYSQQDDGATQPAREAEKFKNLFPRGWDIDLPDLLIGRRSVRGQLNGRGDKDGLNYTPCVINYEARDCG